MCRHLAYLGPELTLDQVVLRPPGGLYEQSWSPRRQQHGTVNADGFGLGWYPRDAPGRPARYRRSVPVWNDGNLPDLARTVRSHAVLAAVRDASPGSAQDESAAAPFADGRWLFSHNGAVPDWTGLPVPGLSAAELLGLAARSDSALLWTLVSRRLRAGEPAPEATAAVVRETAAARPDARLNLLLTDGRSIIATRWRDTLWYRQDTASVLVASEPDGDGADWVEVPADSLLVAEPGRVRVRPLVPAAAVSSARTPPAFTLDRRLPADHTDRSLRADVRAAFDEQPGRPGGPRTLPPKWFYDARGSELFEQITELPEYYPTRAELEILVRRAPEIAARTGARTLVELGSGSSRKTRTLLDALRSAGTLRRYAPLDVSEEALRAAGESVAADYPGLEVAAALADFTEEVPGGTGPAPRLVAFLGSTIGNLDREQRAHLFTALRNGPVREGDALLLGADLVKDSEVLVRAYDDAAGVTAEFNKNVLQVLNRELDADFDPNDFEHVALWNAGEERIEMHLRARRAVSVKIRALDLGTEFAAGETLRTETSAKFRRAGLAAELAAAGLAVTEWWTDPAGRFALLLAEPH
jgi:dimethylhistidine N-methyltransferase/ergothioneine biosynthesis protein EgtC